MRVRVLLFLLATVLLLSCSSVPDVPARLNRALLVAGKYNLSPFEAETQYFNLIGFSKKITTTRPITVYVEGDGFSWVTRSVISDNPTPTIPMLLGLAGLDPKQNLIYLARPCQYIAFEYSQKCHPHYWTSHRYSEEVVLTYMEVLDFLQREFSTSGFHLVGYSGGGAIVALLASRRNDVLSLRTISGNLDHVRLNAEKRVSPLTGSLNPIDFAKSLKNIPQIHFSGMKDEVVPVWVARSFVKTVGGSECVRAQSVRGASHLVGWNEVWENLSTLIPSCKN